MEQLYNSQNEIQAVLSPQLQENIAVIEALFQNCDDIVKKQFVLQRAEGTTSVYMVYVDGLTDSDMVQEYVIRPLLWRESDASKDIFQEFFQSKIDMADIAEEASFDKAVNRIMMGDTVLFIDGYARVITISSKKLPVRSIQESETEAVMRGPRDSFNESLQIGRAHV